MSAVSLARTVPPTSAANAAPHQSFGLCSAIPPATSNRSPDQPPSHLLVPSSVGCRVETLNDADGWLVNAWRAIRNDPAQVAPARMGPVTKLTTTPVWRGCMSGARTGWCRGWRATRRTMTRRPPPGGCTCWRAASATPFGGGPWRVIDGRLTDARTLGDAGQGVNRELPTSVTPGGGVNRELPTSVTPGRGVNRELPHLGNAGEGIAALPQPPRRTAPPRPNHLRIVGNESCNHPSTAPGPEATVAAPSSSTCPTPPGDLYAAGDTDGSISAQVRAWCAEAPDTLRIVLCGYDDEHDTLTNTAGPFTTAKPGGGGTTPPTRSADAANGSGRHHRVYIPREGCCDFHGCISAGQHNYPSQTCAIMGTKVPPRNVGGVTNR